MPDVPPATGGKAPDAILVSGVFCWFDHCGPPGQVSFERCPYSSISSVPATTIAKPRVARRVSLSPKKM